MFGCCFIYRVWASRWSLAALDISAESKAKNICSPSILDKPLVHPHSVNMHKKGNVFFIFFLFLLFLHFFGLIISFFLHNFNWKKMCLGIVKICDIVHRKK